MTAMEYGSRSKMKRDINGIESCPSLQYVDLTKSMFRSTGFNFNRMLNRPAFLRGNNNPHEERFNFTEKSNLVRV